MKNVIEKKTVDEPADRVNLQPARGCAVLPFPGPRLVYKTVLSAAILLLASSTSMAGNSAPPQAANPPSKNPRAGDQTVTQILIPAFLDTSLDSKKWKPGAEVVVKTAGTVRLTNKEILPRGTKIVGRVTEAKTRTGSDTESSLGIVFDRIVQPHGKTLTIKGVIRAVAPNPNPPESGGGVSYDDIAQTVTHSTPSAGGSSSVVPVLTEESVGVQGIKNLQLGPDGVFRSGGKTVKLETRSQIILRVQLTGGA
jgi:hypothetical protein